MCGLVQTIEHLLYDGQHVKLLWGLVEQVCNSKITFKTIIGVEKLFECNLLVTLICFKIIILTPLIKLVIFTAAEALKEEIWANIGNACGAAKIGLVLENSLGDSLDDTTKFQLPMEEENLANGKWHVVPQAVLFEGLHGFYLTTNMIHRTHMRDSTMQLTSVCFQPSLQKHMFHQSRVLDTNCAWIHT